MKRLDQCIVQVHTYKGKRISNGPEVIGSQTCGDCGLKGHYSTTCPLNPNRSCAVKKRGMPSGGVTKSLELDGWPPAHGMHVREARA